MKKQNIVIFVSVITILIIGSIVTVIMSNMGGCGPDDPNPMEEFSVHEWGIFKQKYASDNETYSNGPRPGIVPMPEVVDQAECKPVLYFHGDGLMDLSMNISYSGRDIVTIPQANISNGVIKWNSTMKATSVQLVSMLKTVAITAQPY